jgi:phosphoserine phosphatase
MREPGPETPAPAPAGAAFVRLEGALTPLPAWRAAQWLATRAPSVRRRVLGGALTFLSAGRALHPALGAGRDALRTSFRSLEGLSRDRLEILGEDYATEQLLPAVSPEARRLLDEARARGRRTVLIAETPSVVAAPLAAALGIDDVIANVLAFEGNRCTGELGGELVGPELDPKQLTRHAERLGVSLAASAAYGSDGADRLLLGAVGWPCALHPDAELARLARDLDWPIVGPMRAPLAALGGLGEAWR